MGMEIRSDLNFRKITISCVGNIKLKARGAATLIKAVLIEKRKTESLN